MFKNKDIEQSKRSEAANVFRETVEQVNVFALRTTGNVILPAATTALKIKTS